MLLIYLCYFINEETLQYYLMSPAILQIYFHITIPFLLLNIRQLILHSGNECFIYFFLCIFYTYGVHKSFVIPMRVNN